MTGNKHKQFNTKTSEREKSFSLLFLSFLLVFSLTLPAFLYVCPSENAYAAVQWPEAPENKAFSAVLMEASTGSVIYEKKPYDKAFPASTTKLMTTLLAIEQCQLTEKVEMTYDAIYGIGWDASRVGMYEGEVLTMEEALYAILLASANEVCYSVAEYVADGDIDRFIEMMNERARELGCKNSQYKNPHGLHDASHYTCAYDLALVMKKCLEYPTFSRISNNYYYTLPASDYAGERVIAQTHKILRRTIRCEGVFAGKTGHTDEAGNCLVTAAERNGMTLIAVVMGEPADDDCYTDTINLLEYGFANFELQNAQTDAQIKNAFPVLFSDEDAFSHKIISDLSISETMLVLPKGAKFADVSNKCTLYPIITMYEGQNIIGTAIYYYGDREVGVADVIYTSDSEQIVDPAALYLQEYRDTDEFDEGKYQELAGNGPVEEEPPEDLRPLIIGYIVAILVLGFGLTIFIGIYRKMNSKNRYRRR